MNNKQEKAVLFDLFGTLCGSTNRELAIIDRFGLDLKIHRELESELQIAVCGTKFVNWEKYFEKVTKTVGIPNTLENRRIIKEIIDLGLENKATIIPEAREEVLTYLSENNYKLEIVSNCYPLTR